MDFSKVSSKICASGFSAIMSFLKINNPIEGADSELNNLITQGVRCPLFVTWTTTSDSELRGCIGTLAPVPISEIKSFAQASAFQDTRSPPITEDEVKDLTCQISLLHTYEDCDNPLDWIVGKHGIRISFSHNGRRYSATYLPEVAKEHNMSKEEAIQQLIRKSGFYGSKSQIKDLEVERYQSAKFKLTYEEFIKLEM